MVYVLVSFGIPCERWLPINAVFFLSVFVKGFGTLLSRLAGSEDCFSPVVTCLRLHLEICLSINIYPASPSLA